MKDMHRLSICILAGGHSQRMGHNKALMPFQGQPMIKRVVERVSSLTGEIFIVADNLEDYQFLRIPIHDDIVKGFGALGGLYTALMTTSSSYLAVLACDMPFVNNELIKGELKLMMNDRVDVVIPTSNNGLEPLHALYRCTTCLPQVRQALSDDHKRLISWMDHVKVRILTVEQTRTYDPFGISFLNINTPQDLVKAELIAQNPVY